ncbi:hypothetical protein J4G08_08490 [Candidatus Poribacteria bacterium]|nr:hypothetical protein [Candidatus Poribacteria bacterium]
MNPNKVKALLNTLINELKLPIHVSVSHNGPTLVFGPGSSSTRSRAKNVLEHWSDGGKRSWVISVGLPVKERDKAATRLALDTHRTTEIRHILESLIAEQTLPLTVVDGGFQLEILTDEGIDYCSEDMMQLEALLTKEGIDVPVRHSGFSLRHKEDDGELLFSEVNTLANHLSSLLVEHGLHVRLLHNGFRLHKDQDDAIDIAEVKELIYRLKIMVGIRYIQDGCDYSNDVSNPEIHWKSADVNTAFP